MGMLNCLSLSLAKWVCHRSNIQRALRNLLCSDQYHKMAEDDGGGKVILHTVNVPLNKKGKSLAYISLYFQHYVKSNNILQKIGAISND